MTDFTIEAVITKPRPAHHRGSVPVLELCEEQSLTVHTPSNKGELSDLFAIQPFTSSLGIVIDYGIIINQDVIDVFPLGIVNSHFSLLPEWRGADPITFSILSGQAQTGVSLMLINDKMDEGPLLAQAIYDLSPDITTPQLTNDLVLLSDAMLKAVLPHYLDGTATAQPQLQVSLAISKEPTYSRKLTKDDGIIDWSKPAAQIEREIRAFIEWPKSHARLGEIEVVITKAHVVPSDGKPSEIEVDTVSGTLTVHCGENSLGIDRLKPAGKKEMSTQEFIRGYGSRISN
jgi:methionyl-tRNA formyltransferase